MYIILSIYSYYILKENELLLYSKRHRLIDHALFHIPLNQSTKVLIRHKNFVLPKLILISLLYVCTQ